VEDSISRSLFLYKKYHLDHIEKTIAFLQQENGYKNEEGTILDIGANNGVISIGMLSNGYMSRSIAIEPDPTNYSILLDNAKLNNLDDSMICLNVAASDSKSSLDFELSADNYGDHRIRNDQDISDQLELYQETERQIISVPADTIDNILEGLDGKFKENIALIWIDIQGHEGFAFEGAKKLFSKDIHVVSEIWPYGILRSGKSLEDFFAIVRSMWPNFWVWRKNKFVKYPIEYFSYFLDELGTDGDFDDVIFSK
jgi:FkbM family methyltransferase